MERELSLEEDGLAPLPKALTCSFQLVKEHLIGLGVACALAPSILDNSLEVGQLRPEIFKTESVGSSWSLVASQKQRAVIGERG